MSGAHLTGSITADALIYFFAIVGMVDAAFMLGWIVFKLLSRVGVE